MMCPPYLARAVVVALMSAASVSAQSFLPWEVWDDLRRVAVVPAGDQVELRSSHCLDGCAFDRHSLGDERVIRMDRDEGVVFEERGPGAVVRIWMTTGEAGLSTPLDPSTSIRFYLDGEPTPRIDLPLPALFDGTEPPFLPPLVGNRLASSGGNFSYVPIPFSESCRIVLAGDLTQRLWFQFTFHRLAPDASVETFTGAEDLSGLVNLLWSDDPWPPGSGTVEEGSVQLNPGVPRVLWTASEPATLTELTLDLPPPAWPAIRATVSFDGRVSVDMPLADLFGAGGEQPIQSVWLRAEPTGMLSAYFPMPFERSASVALTQEHGPGVRVDYRIRVDDTPPLAGSGRFAASLSVSDPSTVGVDHLVLDETVPGKWVGLVARLGSVGTASRTYLEGDERIYVDGLRHPTLYGTGTEDFFNAGFYFDQGLFAKPLHGLLESGVTPEGEHSSVAYRFLLTDALPHMRSVRVGLEGGGESDLPIRARTVAYHYVSPRPPSTIVDELDLGDPVSRADHGYSFGGLEETRALDGLFEGEPPLVLVADGSYREAGPAQFLLDSAGCVGELRLRRLWDAGIEGQLLDLSVDGVPSGGSEYTLGNPWRRWAERDLDLPSDAATGGFLLVDVAAQPVGVGGEFTAFRYELLCRGPGGEVFADGFESGDTVGWSARGD